MNRIADFFIKRSFVVNLLTGFLLIMGTFVALTMQRDLIPPFQWSMISVDIVLPGATPEEMERYVTFPIEEALKGAPGVERIDSVSKIGGTSIQLMYESGFPQMSEAVNMIESRINAIRPRLPDGIRHINVQRTQVNDVFLFYLGFPGLDDKNQGHRVWYKNFVKAVNNVPGIVDVKEGLKRRDIYVLLDHEKLNENEISVSHVRQSLARALNFAPIGQMMIGDDKFAVRIDKIANSVEDMANLPLRTSQYGKTVLLKDVAEVRYKNADKKNADFYNGKRGTFTTIRKDMSSDSIDMKPKVQKVIDEFNAKAPEGVEIINVADGPYFIEQQLSVLTKNGIVGFFLVLIILMAFLNFRTAFWAALGLPISYAGALIVIAWMGIKIDLLSIIGMILVIGILVDDAIIVAEKYVENLQKGFAPQKAASEAVRSLMVPVFGTVLTTIVAFAPMILIKSEMAAMLFAVPVVVISALCLSFFESFFMLPNHLAHFVKEAPKDGRMDHFMAWLRGIYEKALTKVLRFRYPVFASILAMMGVAYYLGTYHIKHNFKLNVNSEHVVVYAVLKDSQSIEQSRQAIDPIEKFLLDMPKNIIENVETEIGLIYMNGRKHEGFEFTKIKAYLDRTNPYPSSIKEELRGKLKGFLETIDHDQFSKLLVEVEQQDSDLTKSHMISARILGSDEIDFQEIENRVAQAATAVEAIDEYSPDPDRYQNSWVFIPNLKNLSQYGIDHQEVAHQIRSYFTPDEVIETRIAGENVFVYTEFVERKTLGFSHLRELTVTSTKGIHVPLSFLGDWKKSKSLKKITHYSGERNLTMDFRISDGFNKASAEEQLASALNVVAKEYPNYRMQVVAANADEAKNELWAMKVAIVCVAGVLLVMSLILGSLSQALIVGLPIPFGFIGIILALYVHDLPLGVMALVGLVGTIGVAVNDSIVMVDHINQKTAHFVGVRSPRDLIVKGASSRLRAILLTTVTTLVGIFPIAYSVGGESGFTQPLTFAMGWGLSFSTILTLFLLPALLEIREDVLEWGRRLTGSKAPTKPKEKLLIEEVVAEDKSFERFSKVISPERWHGGPPPH